MDLSQYTLLIVISVFALLFAVEKLFPLRESRSGLIARLVVNAILSGLVFVIAVLTVRPFAMRALNWTSEAPFGLLHLVPMPVWMQAVAGLLLLDLSFYYWHVLNHKLPLLWRFHNVHHIDPDLDVSTGFRFHFGEVLFSVFFRVAQVSLIGVSLPVFVAYEIVFQANTLFHHSNLRLPIRLERCLNKILVTPRMHGIHHSQVQGETNSNYGVVFPWWDRLHRTLGLNIPQAMVEIGIPAYSSPDDNRIWRALVMPFVKQRDYWCKSDGTVKSRDATDLDQHRSLLAE